MLVKLSKYDTKHIFTQSEHLFVILLIPETTFLRRPQ